MQGDTVRILDRLTLPLGLAVVAILLTVAKVPDIMLGGRFWAEEAAVFLPDLFGRGFEHVLGYVYRGNYFVFSNAVVWIATRWPVAYWPLVTSWLSLLLFALAAVQYGIWARSEGIGPPAILLGLAALVLLPAQYEVEASATNVQWICSLSGLLCLLTREDALRRWAPFWILYMGAAGLTGVCTDMLAPFFLARAVLGRSRLHGAIGVVLTITAILQVISLMHQPPQGRPFHLDPYLTLVAIVTQTLVGPILSPTVAGRLGEHAVGSGPAILFGLLLSIGCLSGAAVLARLGALGGGKERALSILLLIGAWVVVSALNSFGALAPPMRLLDPSHGGRYYFLGSCALVLLLVLVTGRMGLGRATALGLLGLIVATGIATRLFSSWPHPYVSGPEWSAQIGRCRAEMLSVCPVRIWPYEEGRPAWRVILSGHFGEGRGEVIAVSGQRAGD